MTEKAQGYRQDRDSASLILTSGPFSGRHLDTGLLSLSQKRQSWASSIQFTSSYTFQ